MDACPYRWYGIVTVDRIEVNDMMKERQRFEARAAEAHQQVERLWKSVPEGIYSTTEDERVSDILHEAMWLLHDVAYSA